MNLDNLPDALPLDGTELVAVMQNGVWCKANLSLVLTTTPVAITAVPTGFTATDIDYQQIDLAWTSGAADFIVERSLDESSWQPIYQGATASYSDTGLYGENTYFYRVAAIDTGEVASEWVYADATTPSAP